MSDEERDQHKDWLRYGLDGNPPGYSPHWDAIRSLLAENAAQARRIVELMSDSESYQIRAERAEADLAKLRSIYGCKCEEVLARAEKAEADAAALDDCIRRYETGEAIARRALAVAGHSNNDTSLCRLVEDVVAENAALRAEKADQKHAAGLVEKIVASQRDTIVMLEERCAALRAERDQMFVAAGHIDKHTHGPDCVSACTRAIRESRAEVERLRELIVRIYEPGPSGLHALKLEAAGIRQQRARAALAAQGSAPKPPTE